MLENSGRVAVFNFERIDYKMNGLLLAAQIVQLISCLALVVVVLFQSGKSAGLSSAIMGGSDTFMSKNKGKSLDAKLAKATKWIAIVFIVLTLVLNIL